jgi:hypothetical protein
MSRVISQDIARTGHFPRLVLYLQTKHTCGPMPIVIIIKKKRLELNQEAESRDKAFGNAMNVSVVPDWAKSSTEKEMKLLIVQ